MLDPIRLNIAMAEYDFSAAKEIHKSLPPVAIYTKSSKLSILIMEGRIEEAEELFHKMKGEAPDVHALINVEAQLEMAKGNISRSRELFERALEKNKFDFGALTGLIVCDTFDGNVVAAEKRMDELGQKYPDLVNIRLLAPSVLWQMGKLDLALQAAREVLKDNPRNVDVMLIGIGILVTGGRLKRAQKFAGFIPRILPDGTRSLFVQGQIEYFKGNYASAKQLFDSAVQKNQYNIMAQIFLIYCDIALDKTAEARDRLQQAQEKYPEIYEFDKLETFLDMKEGNDVKAFVSSAIDLIRNPNDIQSLQIVAKSMLDNGVTSKAIEIGEKLVKMGLPQGYLILAEASLKDGKYAEAKWNARRAAKSVDKGYKFTWPHRQPKAILADIKSQRKKSRRK